jgi:monothiol glutaredoxin
MRESLRTKIQTMVDSDRVVLFMKGTAAAPQCGFSATVVSMLRDTGVPFSTFDVLADPELREGIKVFADWPTIPQLYIGGEFQGGCDIVREMHASGDLHKKLGAARPQAVTPALHLSAAAAAAITAAAEEGQTTLRLSCDANFRHELYFDQGTANDVTVRIGGVSFCIDPASSRRVDGLRIDYEAGGEGDGFRIANPNQPPQVGQMSVEDLKAKLDDDTPMFLFDVRGEDERAIARIGAAEPFSPGQLGKVAKDALVIFHCHHGGRSQHAAAQAVQQGFTNVHNLVGGIQAWSERVDPNVPTY